MALHSLYCADVPLRNCSLTHSFPQRVWAEPGRQTLMVHFRAGPRFCEAQGGGYVRGPLLPSVPSPSLSSPLFLPSLTFPYPFPTLSLSLPLEVGP